MTYADRIRNIRCGSCASTTRGRLGGPAFVVLDVTPGRYAVTLAADAPERRAAGTALRKSPSSRLVDERVGIGDFARRAVRRTIGRFGPV